MLCLIGVGGQPFELAKLNITGCTKLGLNVAMANASRL